MRGNKLLYNFAIALLSVIALCIFTVSWTGYAIHQNNRPFCAVIVTITEPRPVPPTRPESESVPQTTTGEELVAYQKLLEKYNDDTAAYNKKVYDRLHNLSKQYDCTQGES